jgi:3D (Asp-Asp-Asp) domain-containing protein
VKFSFAWRLFLVLLPLGSSSAFGQAYPQLVCDSISASKSKCGYTTRYSDPWKIYLQQVHILSADEWVGHCPQMTMTITLVMSGEDCTEDVTVERNYTPGVPEGCDDNRFILCDGDIWDYAISDTEAQCDDIDQHRHWTLSDEYTTAMLIANTIGALPPYPGSFTGVCSAYRNLSSDETSYSIQRFRYKFTFAAAAQPFVIHWVERFSPTGNESPTDTPQSEQIPIGATESRVHEVLEPASNGTVTIEDLYTDAATVEVETASIRDGEFVITVISAGTGTLDLIFKRQGSNDQIVLKTFDNQSPGTVTVRFDDVMNAGATPLDGQDGIAFDRAAARWRAGEVDVTSADRNFDVPVEVLSQRTLSNYFSPTWGGRWHGGNPQKGVYSAGQFPVGLYNAHVRTQLLDALDPFNEGLAMDGNTVIRAQVQPAQRRFPQYIFLNGTDRGYIEFPDRDQRNTASGSTVQFLRSASVAVRPDADRLNYRTADQVYVPGFGIRTVDDAGGLHGNSHQIDVWIGQGDSAVKAEADAFGIRTRTCLKILNQ